MRLHLGETKFPGKLSFLTGKYRTKGNPWTNVFTVHQIVKMWGVSFGAKRFFGAITFREHPHKEYRQDPAHD